MLKITERMVGAVNMVLDLVLVLVPVGSVSPEAQLTPVATCYKPILLGDQRFQPSDSERQLSPSCYWSGPVQPRTARGTTAAASNHHNFIDSNSADAHVTHQSPSPPTGPGPRPPKRPSAGYKCGGVRCAGVHVCVRGGMCSGWFVGVYK